jgi:broad specificity phosphatase PhoE
MALVAGAEGRVSTCNRKVVILVRHFTAEGTSEDCLDPMDPPLQAIAELQASALESKLNGHQFDAVFCSELRRTTESAALIARTIKLPSPVIDWRLNELHTKGNWRRITGPELRLLVDRDTRNQLSNREIIEEDTALSDRARDFLSDMGTRDFRSALVISHYNAIRAMLQLAAGYVDLNLDRPYRCAYGSYSVISKKIGTAENWKIDAECEDTHLAAHILRE